VEPWRSIRSAAPALAAAACLAVPGHAIDLPDRAPDRHLGVATCAGSLCHGGLAPDGPVVRQNEYTTWSRHDAHSRAYAVLLEDRSLQIARNLSLGKPPHEEPLCLGCHTDYLPPGDGRRGPEFHLEDGVGCEACHGGSERWIETHTLADRHAENVARGMYPTDDALARAELCVSCHFGRGEELVTHRIMGAGHPRMSFELDTFSQIQPAHHTRDGDYLARGKESPPSIKLWALGQAVLVRAELDVMLDPQRGRDGVWPELVLFDCHSCHHAMSELRWRPRKRLGALDRPGLPHFNDSSLLMLHDALVARAPELAAGILEGTRDLHGALARGAGDPRAAAGRLRERVERALPLLARWNAGAADVRAIGRSLAGNGVSGELDDYAGAEQRIMAVQSVRASLFELDALAPEQAREMDALVEAMLRATTNHERYQPAALRPLFERLAGSLR
jgi:hypothetical protein